MRSVPRQSDVEHGLGVPVRTLTGGSTEDALSALSPTVIRPLWVLDGITSTALEIADGLDTLAHGGDTHPCQMNSC
jgi:hypothetical protein